MSFRDQLIGAWELVVYTGVNKEDENDVAYPMGQDCKGMLMYTPDGYVAANLNRTLDGSYAAGSFQGTAEERAQAAADTFAYSGTYYVEDEPRDGVYQLYHKVKLSLPRNWIGSVQWRPASISEADGETVLLLAGEAITDDTGVARVPKIKWRKMKANKESKPPEKS